MNKSNLDSLKNELSIEAKNGVDFIISASIVWAVIAFIWTFDLSSYAKRYTRFMLAL